MLKWIFERVEGTVEADQTAIGFVPKANGIDISGLAGVSEKMGELLKVEKTDWNNEIELIKEHYAKFGDRLPKEMHQQFDGLVDRIGKN